MKKYVLPGLFLFGIGIGVGYYLASSVYASKVTAYGLALPRSEQTERKKEDLSGRLESGEKSNEEKSFFRHVQDLDDCIGMLIKKL